MLKDRLDSLPEKLMEQVADYVDFLMYRHEKLFESEDRVTYSSVVSLWKMVVKTSLGKLKLKQDISCLKSFINRNGFQMLPVAFEHLEEAKILEFYHRAPCDRSLIAQGLAEQITIATKDLAFPAYGVFIL